MEEENTEEREGREGIRKKSLERRQERWEWKERETDECREDGRTAKGGGGRRQEGEVKLRSKQE